MHISKFVPAKRKLTDSVWYKRCSSSWPACHFERSNTQSNYLGTSAFLRQICINKKKPKRFWLSVLWFPLGISLREVKDGVVIIWVIVV
jgi:hypothetical protein